MAAAIFMLLSNDGLNNSMEGEEKNVCLFS